MPTAAGASHLNPIALTESRSRPLSVRISAAVPLAVAAVVTLGTATQINFGQYAPAAMVPLAVSLAACVAAVAWRGGVSERIAVATLLLGLLVQFRFLLTDLPCATWPAGAAREAQWFRAIVFVAAAAAVASVAARRGPSRAAGVLIVVAYVAAGAIVLRTVPQPGVDVCTFQREAADALLAGTNPYAITFADPYGPSSGFYGADVIRDGRTTWGYPYPPLPLLLAVPAHAIGDFRWAPLAATALAAVLLLCARPTSTWATPAVALLLFTPRGFFVLEAGWIEPFVLLGLAAVVFFACRWRATARDDTARRRRAPAAAAGDDPPPAADAFGAGRTQRDGGAIATPSGGRRRVHVTGWVGLAIATGLFLATKQYLVLAVPLLWLLPDFRARTRRAATLALAAGVAAGTMLPLALWDAGAFLRSAVTLQFHQPFRPDALSFLVPIAGRTGHAPPAWIPFAAALAVTVVALRRSPRSPAGFALAVAAVFCAFFAFNKQAFCNYYHFVIAALCCGLAATDPQLPTGPSVPQNLPAA